MFSKKPSHRDAEHDGADDVQHAEVALEERVIDQQFGDVGLNQREGGGGDAYEQNDDEPRLVRDDEFERLTGIRPAKCDARACPVMRAEPRAEKKKAADHRWPAANRVKRDY